MLLPKSHTKYQKIKHLPLQIWSVQKKKWLLKKWLKGLKFSWAWVQFDFIYQPTFLYNNTLYKNTPCLNKNKTNKLKTERPDGKIVREKWSYVLNDRSWQTRKHPQILIICLVKYFQSLLFLNLIYLLRTFLFSERKKYETRTKNKVKTKMDLNYLEQIRTGNLTLNCLVLIKQTWTEHFMFIYM